jgi:hypothetical protein
MAVTLALVIYGAHLITLKTTSPLANATDTYFLVDLCLVCKVDWDCSSAEVWRQEGLWLKLHCGQPSDYDNTHKKLSHYSNVKS